MLHKLRKQSVAGINPMSVLPQLPDGELGVERLDTFEPGGHRK